MMIAEGSITGAGVDAYMTAEGTVDGKVTITITEKDGRHRWSGTDLAAITIDREDFKALARMW